MRGRPFHGWILVAVLAVTETISYGILVYAFTVFLEPMRRDTGWSLPLLTGGFSLGLLVAGALAIPVGRMLDRRGARLPMSVGSGLAAAALWAWSHAATPAGYLAAWAVLGVAMAMVLYEPAFAVLAVWFRRRRGRALTILTFVAGFASVIFVPLAGHLVEAHGWREALRILALVQAATLPLHAAALRHRPADVGQRPDGLPGARPPAAEEPPEGVPAAEAFARPDFAWLALAFSLSTFVVTALSVHLVPLLVASGRGAPAAAAIAGAVGLMALPGRLILTPLGEVWPRHGVTAGIFVLQAAGLAVLATGAAPATVWTFVALYGAGFGAITPARAALLADTYGGREFGRIGGRMAVFHASARAAAPLASGALVALAGHRALLVLTVAGCLAAAIAVWIARRPGGPRRSASAGSYSGRDTSAREVP